MDLCRLEHAKLSDSTIAIFNNGVMQVCLE
jgi:hypothetical protein